MRTSRRATTAITGKGSRAISAVTTGAPYSRFAASQYWIGESYYSQGKYNEAILAYNEILVAWPKSERVPAALLRQATAFASMGDKIDARLILQKLIADHPGTQEAELAKNQLRALGA